jgi:imidazolonepropionase
MIRADRIFTGIREVATLAAGPVPRIGPAMSELGIVRDAAMASDRGRFVWVGPARQLRRSVALRAGGRRTDLGGVSVVPGFVDAHTHLLFAGDRHREIAWKLDGTSYTEIARRGGGLYSTVEATRKATTAELRTSALDRLGRMARWGTTTAEVKSGYALDVAGELRLLRLVPELARRSGVRLVPTYLGAHAIPRDRAGGDRCIDEIIRRALPVVAREKLARYCDVFCEPGFFTTVQSERLLRAASALGLGLKIHADEFVASGGAELAARLGVTSAEHLLAASPGTYPALARAGVTAVLLPVTPMAALSDLRSPGRALVDAGVAVALGTDLSPNSWVEGMPIVLAHAVYSARLTPEEALTAATVNAAHAIGVSDVAGQIAAGRPADFSTFRMGSTVEIPYRFGALPDQVYRRAEPVFSS